MTVPVLLLDNKRCSGFSIFVVIISLNKYRFEFIVVFIVYKSVIVVCELSRILCIYFICFEVKQVKTVEIHITESGFVV